MESIFQMLLYKRKPFCYYYVKGNIRIKLSRIYCVIAVLKAFLGQYSQTQGIYLKKTRPKYLLMMKLYQIKNDDRSSIFEP